MKPPVGLANEYARYLAKRYARLAEVDLTEGFDRNPVHFSGRFDSSDWVNRAIGKLVRVAEENPVPDAHLNALAAQVDKRNRRVIGISNPELIGREPTNRNWLVIQDVRNPDNPAETNPYVWRESRTEKAARAFRPNRAQKGAGPLRIIPPGTLTGKEIPGSVAMLGSKTSPMPGGPIANFRDNNLALIRKLDAETVNQLRTVLEQAEREAWRVEQLKVAIAERFEVAKSHAELIARDQVMKLNGQITEYRQTSAGVTHYEWSTSGDERVRPMHDELDGTIQSWAAPPITTKDGQRNHPGQDIQCRCVAIPQI